MVEIITKLSKILNKKMLRKTVIHDGSHVTDHHCEKVLLFLVVIVWMRVNVD